MASRLMKNIFDERIEFCMRNAHISIYSGEGLLFRQYSSSNYAGINIIYMIST